MIIETNTGRRKSIITKEEKRADLLKRLKNLNAEERTLLRQVIDEVGGLAREGEFGFESPEELKANSIFYNSCVETHYEDRLVSVEEFCLDSRYLGHVGKYFYKRWLEDMKELFSRPYNEAIVTGSIGSGKTTFADMSLAYMFYELCMLKDPQATFGLMPGSEIVLVCFNRDQQLARDVTFGGFKRKLEASPFFRDELGIKFGTSELEYMEKGIKVIAISARSANALGRDVFGGIIDETDFMEGSVIKGGLPKPGEKPFAEQLHANIKRRMATRFDRAGVLPGKLIMSSSARHKQSFSNKRMSEGSTDPSVFCRDYAIYEVAPPERFSKERFWVLVGNERINHKILTRSEYRAMGRGGRAKLEAQGCRFIRVPMNFKPDFERNIEDAIRDIAGVVTVSMAPFFQVRSRLYDMVDPTLSHPAKDIEWVTDSPLEIDWTHLVKKYRRRIGPGMYAEDLRPIRHPEAQRHVHIDLSLGLSDPAGLCIGHIVDMIDVERRDDKFEPIKELAPLIEIDLILRILAPPGGEIDFGAIRGLLYDFQRHGYPISFASLDSFQSRDMLQQLEAKGIDGEIISVDKTTEPYTTLKTGIYEGRLSVYKYPILVEELEQLQRDEIRKRIDHPQGGTKDCADALCGVVYSLTTKHTYAAPIAQGVSEYKEEGVEDSEWIRKTMHRSGDKAPIEVKDDDYDGPVFLMG